jgi:hypothetical protein
MRVLLRLLGLVALIAVVTASAAYFPSIFGLVLLSAMFFGMPLLAPEHRTKEALGPSVSDLQS